MADQTHQHFPVPCALGTLSIMPCLPVEGTVGALERLRAAGVTDILSMLPASEAQALGVQEEQALCARLGIAFLSHPIKDFGLPQMEDFSILIQDIVRRLEGGAHVAVHCRAGIGRSGMTVAATLIALGATPNEAQNTVSTARCVSIPDTVPQFEFIKDFALEWAKTDQAFR